MNQSWTVCFVATKRFFDENVKARTVTNGFAAAPDDPSACFILI
jgi:hypothetical protein